MAVEEGLIWKLKCCMQYMSDREKARKRERESNWQREQPLKEAETFFGDCEEECDDGLFSFPSL